MSEIEEFIAAPSQESLDSFSKEQLLLVAEHFSVVVVGDKRLKENIKAAIKAKLLEIGQTRAASKFHCFIFSDARTDF